MANAFFIMAIVVAIFAVVAFDLFADLDPIDFGSFSRAYFTMFQARTRASRDPNALLPASCLVKVVHW